MRTLIRKCINYIVWPLHHHQHYNHLTHYHCSHLPGSLSQENVPSNHSQRSGLPRINNWVFVCETSFLSAGAYAMTSLCSCPRINIYCCYWQIFCMFYIYKQLTVTQVLPIIQYSSSGPRRTRTGLDTIEETLLVSTSIHPLPSSDPWHSI